MAANRRRKSHKLRFRGILVLVAIVFCAFFGAFSAQAVDDPEDLRELKPVYIVEGDTLWSLVEEHCDTNNDIRESIYEVKRINYIDNSQLIPGQVIYIPIS